MPTTSQLKKAVIISEKLDELQAELAALLGGSSKPSKIVKEPKAKPDGRKKNRTMSPEAREKIAAAQRRRWKKQKAEKA